MPQSRRTLIVGVGSIGERHLRCFGNTQRTQLAICETNAALRKSISDRYSILDQYEAYDEAIAHRFDIVVICTPAHLHIEMASKAVASGASVLIEKPLSTSDSGIDGLIKAVHDRGVTAGVAYVYRCHPSLAAMRQAILDGRIGQPLTIVAQSGQHFPFYRPAYRDTYYCRRETGGGAVQDALTHVVNAGEWLVGPVTELVADCDHQRLEGVEVEDTVHVLTRHGKIMGCFNLNQHQAPNEATITVIGTHGTARFEFHANRWRWMLEPGSEWHDEPIAPLERDSLFTIQAQSFLDAVDERRAPRCRLEEARQTLAVNLAILESVAQRRWITID